MTIWHSLIHIFGIDYGSSYGHWVWYNFWSGVSGSFLVGVVAWIGVYYIHHTCHAKSTCFRWGKYEAANGTFRLCHKHHPDLNGFRPTHALIAELHAESKANV